LWHSRLPSFPANTARSNICFGAVFEGGFYACAIWTPPTARCLNDRAMLELRRMAISLEAPRNTASRMLGFMSRAIRKGRPDIRTLISYQDMDVHTGAIYRAAGWHHAVGFISRARTWTGWKNRPLRAEQGVAARMRWELDL
jgi:hypothetical protein